MKNPFDTSLDSLRQTFDPLGAPPAKKDFLIMDLFAYNLVYGNGSNGPNPEDYLPQIDPEQKPEYLLFPRKRPPPVA